MTKITYPAFEITKGKDKKFYWVLKSSNGRTILRAIKGYKTKQNCQKNIALVLKNGVQPEKYFSEVANQSGNGFYFCLNGRKRWSDKGTENFIAISGNGKNYKSVNWQIAELGVNKGIDSCIRNIKRIIAKIEHGQDFIIDSVKDNRRKEKSS